MVTVMYETLFIFVLVWKKKYYVCYCHMKVRVEDGYVKLTETSPHAVVQYMLSEYWSFGFPFPSLYYYNYLFVLTKYIQLA